MSGAPSILGHLHPLNTARVARKSAGIDRQTCGSPDMAALGCFLRGRHRRNAAAAVAARTGVPVGTAENWLAGRASPAGPALLRLLWCYGPDLLAALWPSPPDWLDPLALDAERARLDRELADLAARVRAIDAPRAGGR